MQKAEDWKQGGKFVEISGYNIFVKRGPESKPTLLCLHGFPASSFDYHKVWEGLSRHFSLLAFDMIGYGFSDKPYNFDYTTFAQVDILAKLIAKLDIKSFHILAHDYGNTITQELLARRHEGKLGFEIASICFLNGALFPETHRPVLAQKILISPIGPLFGRLIPERKFRAALAAVFGHDTQPTKAELDEFMFLFNYNSGRRISHKLIRYMTERSTYRERWVEALGTIDQPFRFINGLSDPVSGKHVVKRFRELFPDQTDIVELEEIGHFPHFEAPEDVLRHFLEFQGHS